MGSTLQDIAGDDGDLPQGDLEVKPREVVLSGLEDLYRLLRHRYYINRSLSGVKGGDIFVLPWASIFSYYKDAGR